MLIYQRVDDVKLISDMGIRDMIYQIDMVTVNNNDNMGYEFT